MKRRDAIDILTRRRDEIRERFGVSELAVFGSHARDEATDDSDIDIYVSFTGPATFDGFMDLLFYLEDLLRLKVDLTTHDALRPQLRPRIESEAIRVA